MQRITQHFMDRIERFHIIILHDNLAKSKCRKAPVEPSFTSIIKVIFSNIKIRRSKLGQGMDKRSLVQFQETPFLNALFIRSMLS